MNSGVPVSGVAFSPELAIAEPFRPPLWLRNGHVQSAWQTLFRRVQLAPPQEEVLATSDGDELHLDWYRNDNPRLAILSHGLEGNSRRPYILGLTRALLAAGWDVLAWNFRSCGGFMNHLPRYYHSGATEDLGAVIEHALVAPQNYRQITLGGFSMGGNLTLLYLAQQKHRLDPRIKGSTTFSVPCDLAGCAGVLAQPGQRVYMRRFLRGLHIKMLEKAQRFPEQISVDGFESIRSFQEFDDRYTAPLHGFRDAEDYWASCSCLPRLPEITVPSLMVNAADDPFLSSSCYPQSPADLGSNVLFESPRWGGHVGFVDAVMARQYWSERRAVAFLEQVASP